MAVCFWQILKLLDAFCHPPLFFHHAATVASHFRIKVCPHGMLVRIQDKQTNGESTLDVSQKCLPKLDMLAPMC